MHKKLLLLLSLPFLKLMLIPLKKVVNLTELLQIMQKNKLLKLPKKLISDNSKIAIETVFGDFEEYINNKIEAVIKK